MSDLVREASELAQATLARRVDEWLTAPILGHGLWARYQDARDIIPALAARLGELTAERDGWAALADGWARQNDGLRSVLGELVAARNTETLYAESGEAAFERARALLAHEPEDAS